MRYTKRELKGKAQTVLGPISVDELGITLSHEHCLFDGTCDFVEPKEITAKKIANEPLSFKNESFAVLDIPNDAHRIAQIKDLIAHGYGSQILISHDICQKCHYMAYGGHGYNHILNNAVPAMRRREMIETQINDLLIENPKRFLAFT